MRACPGDHCPWEGEFVVCTDCEAKTWTDGKCEACAVQARITTAAAEAAKAAAALFPPEGAPLLVAAAVRAKARADTRAAKQAAAN